MIRCSPTPRRFWSVGLLALVVVLGCGGGGGGGGGGDTTGPPAPGPGPGPAPGPGPGPGPNPGPGPGPQPGANEVLLTPSTFNPVVRTITRGTTVTWRNTSVEAHTVTPDGHAAFGRQTTDGPGIVFSQRFDNPGTFRYFCEIHGGPGFGMNGQIVVQ